MTAGCLIQGLFMPEAAANGRWTRRRSKFGDYAAPVIGADRARAIVAAVTGMADGTAGLDDLRAHLYAPA